MPITAKIGVTTTKECPDEECEGHVQRSIGVELRTVAQLSRVGANPATTRISSRERVLDIAAADKVCEHCGAENMIGELRDGRDYPQIGWPEPTFTEATLVDEILPVPPVPPTLEERVLMLEQQMAEIRGGG